MGVFANALNPAVEQRQPDSHALSSQRPGLIASLLSRFRRRAICEPRLALVERIILAPRQTVTLIEADGLRVLVATSPEGAPAFFALPSKPNRTSRARKNAVEGELL